MLRIDKAIHDTSDVICNNIVQLSLSDRGLLSQNILSQLRNFVEYVAIKLYSNGQDVNPNDYELNVVAIKDLQRRGNLRFLFKFHEMLQKSVSHYTVLFNNIILSCMIYLNQYQVQDMNMNCLIDI